MSVVCRSRWEPLYLCGPPGPRVGGGDRKAAPAAEATSAAPEVPERSSNSASTARTPEPPAPQSAGPGGNASPRPPVPHLTLRAEPCAGLAQHPEAALVKTLCPARAAMIISPKPVATSDRGGPAAPPSGRAPHRANRWHPSHRIRPFPLPASDRLTRAPKAARWIVNASASSWPITRAQGLRDAPPTPAPRSRIDVVLQAGRCFRSRGPARNPAQGLEETPAPA